MKWLSFVLALIVLAGPVRAADYWPTETTRTYVFGESPDEARLVIQPQSGAFVAFRVVTGDCDVRWNASVESDGTMTATSGWIDCPGVVSEPTEVTFEGGQEVLFDPEWIGGNIRQIQATAGVETVNLYVRVSEARPVTVPDGTFDAVLFRVAIDPLFLYPLLNIDLAIDAGPVRVNDLGRTAVLEGVVDTHERTFGAMKARFGEN